MRCNPSSRSSSTIRQAFCETERPDDAFLQGSREGCEPGESVARSSASPIGHNWTLRFLTQLQRAQFLFPKGLRYFLPAYLIADLEDRLQTADPVFHLTNGFSGKVVKLPAGQRIYEKTNRQIGVRQSTPDTVP